MVSSALSGFMLPDWAVLILLLVGGVYALALLAMPFAVFGVKSRLSAMEEQLEDIQEELRVMALRQAGARIGVMDPAYPEPTKPAPPAAMPPSMSTMAEPPLRRRDGADVAMARPQQAPPQPPPAPPPPHPAPSPLAEPSLRESFGRARPSAPPPPPPAPPRGRRIEPRLD